MTILNKTVYELTCNCAMAPERVRYFDAVEGNVAALRFADHVVRLQNNESVHAAYVVLKRLPDQFYPEGLTLMAWTKVGPGESQADGKATLEELLK